MKNPNPSDATVRSVINRAFGDPKTYRALIRLAEETLGAPARLPQFRDGLRAILGAAGGAFVEEVLGFFSSGRLNSFLEHFGIDETAERNLRVFVARWAPSMNGWTDGDRIRYWDFNVEINSGGGADYCFHFRTNVDELRFRVFRNDAIELLCSVVQLLDRAKELPDGLGGELVRRLDEARARGLPPK